MTPVLIQAVEVCVWGYSGWLLLLLIGHTMVPCYSYRLGDIVCPGMLDRVRKGVRGENKRVMGHRTCMLWVSSISVSWVK